MKTQLNISKIIVFEFLIVSALIAKADFIENPVLGKWGRISSSGPVALEFKENGLVEVDFGNDQTVDVFSGYKIKNDTITFTDKEGQMCPESGRYKMRWNDYYVSFDLINDNCNGRIKMTMGFWTKPNFNELLVELSQKISETQKPESYLSRARISLATGKPNEAKADFDVYIEKNPNDVRAFINRAGTRFPEDMEGAVSDCNKAIALEPKNKDAFFLRGLAFYELGEKEKACENFSKAIELGFSILRIAEHQRCAEYWDQ